MPKTTTDNRPEFKPVNFGAAAIDIGSKMHMAAVNPACTDMAVRTFGTFTQDLHDLADWFKACGVTSGAMESTGVYWIHGTRSRNSAGSRSFWSTRGMPRMCQGARPISAMLRG